MHLLVEGEKDWLVDMFPGAVENYRSPMTSIKNIARIARSEMMKAYIVRRGELAYGVATVIFGQSIVHPSVGTFMSTDLDYWIADGASEGYHEEVAFKLMLRSEDLYRQRRMSQQVVNQKGTTDTSELVPAPHQSIMGTIGKEDPNPSVGLGTIMIPVGEPATLTTPDGDDSYGITKDGRILQLYVDQTTIRGGSMM